VAGRLGVALRDARRAAGLSQASVSAAAGLSQPRYSDLERGLGSGASLETWAVAAAALSEQVVAFLEHAPGASRPRDADHLRRQNAIVERSRGGGWTAVPELAIDDGQPRSRSIDVALARAARREAAVVEVWDWLDDVGATWRSFDAKKLALARRAAADGVAIGGLFVVRDTRRNRAIVRELVALFRARFPGDAAAWLRALDDPVAPMPGADGLLWSRADGRLVASRLGWNGR